MNVRKIPLLVGLSALLVFSGTTLLLSEAAACHGGGSYIYRDSSGPLSWVRAGVGHNGCNIHGQWSGVYYTHQWSASSSTVTGHKSDSGCTTCSSQPWAQTWTTKPSCYDCTSRVVDASVFTYSYT